MLDDKLILVTGGTGSFGKAFTQMVLSRYEPRKLIVFSRDKVIASFGVLEHLFSPRDFLRGCANILSPGGLLVLTCPNAKGFDVMTLGPVSDTVDAEHLNYFHPASLAHLLGECGFSTLEAFTLGKLDAELVRKKAVAGEFDLSDQPFLRHVLIDEWERAGAAFQRFLVDNQLSSHMWIVAEKR